jgi:hypothetical protein
MRGGLAELFHNEAPGLTERAALTAANEAKDRVYYNKYAPVTIALRVFGLISAGKAVANFFTPASKKTTEPVQWSIVHGTLLKGHFKKEEGEGASKRRKVAAFDFVCVTPQGLKAYISDVQGLYFDNDFLRERLWQRCQGLEVAPRQHTFEAERAV